MLRCVLDKLWLSKRKNSPYVRIEANEDLRAGDEFFLDHNAVKELIEYLKEADKEMTEYWKENAY